MDQRRDSRVLTYAMHTVLVLAGSGLPLVAQADGTDRVSAAVRDGALAFEHGPDGFAGPGAEFLVGAASGAEFVLLGESHGNRQTPWLTGELLRALQPAGFTAYATETGPVSTRTLASLAASDGTDGVVAWLRREPFSVAFMNWREEIGAVTAAVEAGYEVWGLDQEFMGCARHLLGRLVELAENDAARELAQGWREKALVGFQHFAKTGGDSSKAFLSVARGPDYAALGAAFPTGEGAEIVAELAATAQIYGLYHQGKGYENNAARIALMKRHLGDRLRAKPGAKVLFRFGSGHMARGFSPFDQLDLGNHCAERAIARGGESLHVYVFARGSRNADGTPRSDYTEASPWLAPVFDATPEEDGKGVVIDLRKLRPLVLRGRKPSEPRTELQRLVLAYDVIVMFDHFDASTELMPGPR